jgi:hypothetical protein
MTFDAPLHATSISRMLKHIIIHDSPSVQGNAPTVCAKGGVGLMASLSEVENGNSG